MLARLFKWPFSARLAAIRALQVAACGAVAWAAIQDARQPPAPVSAVNPATTDAGATMAAPQLAAPSLAPGLATIEVIVRRNDTLDRIFRQFELSLSDLANMRALTEVRRALDRLMPGEQLRLTHREGTLVSLERDLSLTERLQVQRAADGFRAEIVARPVTVETVRTHGVIDSSLFEAGNAAGLKDITILKLAKIFGWDIDFVLDLRDGDQFTLTYERISQDGRYLQDGEILAARFVNQGREYSAVRFTAPDGSNTYYSADGRSMEKAFLRAPLEFRRVSSRFSTGRYHPVLNRVRAHKGVDYAANSGTPVQAAGAGRVQFRGRKGGYGNVLEIDHGGGIVTVYGHLSRFANAARAGSRVQQGQTVGYVGMTGLATGPHLHYEYRVNGRYLDPQKVKLPDARPIDAALMTQFLQVADVQLAALDAVPPPALAAR